MRIKDCMKVKVIYVDEETTIKAAVEILVRNPIGTLPIVDGEMQLIGVVNLTDIIALVEPDFVNLLEDYGFVRDFGAMEAKKPGEDLLNTPIKSIKRAPFCVSTDSQLLYTFSRMNSQDLYDIPVVDEVKRLVGIVSRVDVGTLLLGSWLT